jgi:hypothetical protein
MNCSLEIASTSPVLTMGQSFNDGRNRNVTARYKRWPELFAQQAGFDKDCHDDMVDINRERNEVVPAT